MRQKLLLVAAVFFGILAFVLSYQQINTEKRKIREATIQRDVIVLTENLNAGEKIEEKHLAKKSVRYFKDIGMGEDIPWSKRNDILEKKLTASYEKGSILTWNAIDIAIDVDGPNELNEDIDADKVAIAIPVDSVSSLNGLIRPQNRVDIVGHFADPNGGTDQKAFFAVTLIKDVRVLACGTDRGTQKMGRSRSYSTVTLEVTPEDAKQLILAQRIGRLTLMLRPLDSVLSTQKDRKEDVTQWKNFIDYVFKGVTP